MSSDRSASESESSKISSQAGGIEIDANGVQIGGDVVGRDKLIAGDDIIQTQQYVERQTNINIPRGVQIAIGLSAAAIVAIAGALLTTRPVVANGGFETGTLEGWEVKGAVTVVDTGEPSAPSVGKFAAQLPVGSAIEQKVRVPAGQPVLTISYRSPSGAATRGALNIHINDEVAYRLGNLALAVDWQQATFDMTPYADQEVRLRVEYVVASVKAPGLLQPATPGDESIWIANVQIAEAEADQVALSTPVPSSTPSRIASATATPTAAPPRPTDTNTPQSTATPEAPTARPPAPTEPRAAAAVTTTLTFTWQAGDFRESGRNEQGIGIWAQEVSVTAAGGAPPYTIVFEASGHRQTGSTFEVFGLHCVGQVGTITVESSDGQVASAPITLKAPICPTQTPTPTRTPTPTPSNTPTSTPTPTRTPSNTPTSTPTPTPTQIPLASLPLYDGYLVTIEGIDVQGQGRRAQAAPGSAVTVVVDYFIRDPGCPACIDQILIGIADDATINEPKGCVYHGQPGAAGVRGSGSLTFNVPASPGVYYVRFHYGQDYSCALGWWGIGGTPGPDRSIGAITVQ